MKALSSACQQALHKGCSGADCRCPCHWPPREKRAAHKNPDAKLELYISPDLKLRLGLAQKTTEEYLEKHKR